MDQIFRPQPDVVRGADFDVLRALVLGLALVEDRAGFAARGFLGVSLLVILIP
ncbi:hypothetical protein [Shewanella algidipiscicola]|uniref:Uncharacterized protein n=1 Tax=Shewanella algidipiscicola TaxID=614070 RepID=A0ABQ4PAU2_9GAMM|nr:hypothetical protein [Shewanella algidipiscicola]GIU44643.1 hypothetical protein TUM4630_10820 [Shewanella algidipiscicola]